MAEFRFETERLILRDWRKQDWARFFAVTNTPAVMQWLGGVMDGTKEALTSTRLEAYQRERGFTFWLVERKADGGHLAGEILGFCGLKLSNQAGGPQGEYEIGWRLREDAWGKGYAREAAQACLRIGFEQFAAPRIIALTVLENRRSWGLMERLTMQRRPDLDFASTDFGSDTIIGYAITREDWDQRSNG